MAVTVTVTVPVVSPWVLLVMVTVQLAVLPASAGVRPSASLNVVPVKSAVEMMPLFTAGTVSVLISAPSTLLGSLNTSTVTV